MPDLDIQARPTGDAPDRALPWWARSSTQPVVPADRVRTRTLSGTAGLSTLAGLLAIGFAWVLIGTDPVEVKPVPGGGGLEYRQTTDALVGGCGGVFEYTVEADKIGIVPSARPDGSPYTQAYTTIVPMFGRMWDQSVDTHPGAKRFWYRADEDAPGPERLLRNMWDGEMVVYYTDKASAEDIATLRQLLVDEPELRMLVVPWKNNRGPLPSNRKLAFATWGASQTCQRLVPAALGTFRDGHPANEAPGYTGATPPVVLAGWQK